MKAEKKVHSTQKPEKLLYNVIISSSKIGDIVLDPFFGTGTTGAVAKMTGRNYIGFEQDETYIKYATERIKNTKENIDDIANLSYETKPPKVSMKELLDKKYLHVGQKLYNKNKEQTELLNVDGNVDYKNEILSIHKMSAKLLGKTNNNGWDYFYIEDKDKNLVSINSLRYKYNEETYQQN